MNQVAASLLCLLVSATPSAAQSVFDDGSGRTTLFYPGHGAVTLNPGDSSVQVSYTSVVSDRDALWGVRVKVKSTEGTARLFESGVVSPGASGTAFVGGKAVGSWIAVAKLTYGLDRHTLIDTAADFQSQIAKRTFDGVEGAVHVWGNMPDLGKRQSVAGVAIGWRRVTNYLALDETSVTNRRVIGTADGVVRESATTISGRSGEYVVDGGLFLDADYAVKLPEPLALRVLSRTFVSPQDALKGTTLGVDLSTLKNSDLAQRVLGFLVELDDAFKQRKDPPRLGKRVRVSLLVNLPFPGIL
jgi:hypothetical protein